MNQEQFEDNIKKTFNGHQVPLDTDALWGAIETDLPAKKKRKPFFFWFLSGMSGLLLIGTIAFFQYDNNSSNYVHDNIEIANHFIENKPTLSNSSLETSNIQPTNLNTNLTPQKTKSISSDAQQELSNDSKNERIAKINLTENKSTDLPQNISRKNSLSTKDIKPSAELSTPLAASLSDKKVIIEEFQYIRYENVNQLPLKCFLLDNTITTNPIAVPPTYPKWRVFTTLQGGTIFANKVIKTNNTGIETYTVLRKETETPILSYQFSGLLGVQHQKTNWYIKTGLQYQQINEIFSYEQNSTSTLYSVTGDNKTELTTRTIRHYNQLQLLEIPVLVGKSFRNRNRISFELEVGFATSLSLNANGRFVDEEIELGDLDSDMFRKNNWSVLATVGAAYKISPKTTITLGLAYQQYLGSLRIKEALTKDQYGLIGLRLGVKQVF